MRRLLVALGLMGLISPAFAADYELPPPVPIRPASSTPTYVVGPPKPQYHWGGVYGGIQGGYSSAVVNFGTAASEISALFRNNPAILQDQQISQWPVFSSSSADANSASLGGFIGYNYEWEDVILGLELNYNHFPSPSTSVNGSVTRSFNDSTNLPPGHDYNYTVTASAQSYMQITDIATFRARAGWEVGSFLPYAFGGLAVGRADTLTSAAVSGSYYDVPTVQPAGTPQLGCLPVNVVSPVTGTCLPQTLNVNPGTVGNFQNGAFAYGVATGLGMDIALSTNLFVRGEFEYIFFPPVNGMQVSLWSARVGAAVKF
jgi:outer membrane immunogenic protein